MDIVKAKGMIYGLPIGDAHGHPTGDELKWAKIGYELFIYSLRYA